jgi:hypothetical protein
MTRPIAVRGGQLAEMLEHGGYSSSITAAFAIGVSVDTYRRVMSGAQAPSAAFIAGSVLAVPATMSDLFEVIDRPI